MIVAGSRRGPVTDDSAKPNLYWSQPLDNLLATLHSASDGLSMADARQRLAQFGPNLLRAREKATALGLLLNQFKSPIILILLFATAVSAVLGDWVDALIILASGDSAAKRRLAYLAKTARKRSSGSG